MERTHATGAAGGGRAGGAPPVVVNPPPPPPFSPEGEKKGRLGGIRTRGHRRVSSEEERDLAERERWPSRPEGQPRSRTKVAPWGTLRPVLGGGMACSPSPIGRIPPPPPSSTAPS